MSPSHEETAATLCDCIKHIKNIPVSSGVCLSIWFLSIFIHFVCVFVILTNPDLRGFYRE